MEATVTQTRMTESTRRPLGFGAALVRQFKLLWTSGRPILMGVALLALLVLAGEPWSNDLKPRLLAPWLLWLVLIGPVWAFAVFFNEGPSRRLYHWSLPVDRPQHTLARLAAGLAWLWILYGVLIGVGVLMAAMDGDLWQLGEVSATGWVNFFTGPLLGYLAVSVLTVSSDYPIRWFFGLLLGFGLLIITLKDALGFDGLVETLLEPISAQGWGLMPVMVGGLGRSVIELDARSRAMVDADAVWQTGPEVAHWSLATLLWILLLAALVAVAASRHPDTLPRLRRSG